MTDLWRDDIFDNLVRLKRGHDLPNQNIISGKFPVVASSGIKDFHNDFKASPPIVVTGRSGTLGEVQYITEKSWPLNTTLYSINFRDNLPKYVYYYLKEMHLENFNAGAGVPTLNQNHLQKLKIKIPQLYIQKKVAAILSAYDDLIENNKKRIQILENMAGELYKEWFVRFRFPNYENTEFEKGIPKDWNTINSSEFIDVVKGKSYKSPEIHDEFVDESLPFINLKNFNRGGGYRRNGLKFYTGKYANNQKTYQDDIVMAVTDMTQDRAVVGRVARVPKLNFEFAIISLDCVKLVPKIYSSTFTYCYFKYSGFSEYIKEFANGANVLHLSPNQIDKQKILIPPEQLVDSFEAKVVPIYSELNILEESNEKLEIMRNNLLPRLISGKLSVENLDIQFPPSMQEQ
ncbi:restriction endonuclease subunit S [Acinetobacter sp. ANC 5579]|uniref:restriction endonuclease subunit S n=1 Tax=Acinetobacter amyesii TaxID=2942470 RepID=UPI0020C0C96C|nr:restriction endonuclease subunit S [Acinetobacter amyesii]MCL6236411.1 restriction endonuclease subunit S [Acinetobacter amyesii]